MVYFKRIAKELSFLDSGRKAKMRERRSFPRSKINCLIWYNKSNYGRTRVVMSKNISAIGTIFLSEEFLPHNTGLDLKLKIPNLKETIELHGKVVRVQSTPGIPFYKTAIKFSHPSRRINQAILKNK